jgi:hypothetical protein
MNSGSFATWAGAAPAALVIHYAHAVICFAKPTIERCGFSKTAKKETTTITVANTTINFHPIQSHESAAFVLMARLSTIGTLQQACV